MGDIFDAIADDYTCDNCGKMMMPSNVTWHQSRDCIATYKPEAFIVTMMSAGYAGRDFKVRKALGMESVPWPSDTGLLQLCGEDRGEVRVFADEVHVTVYED